MFIQNHIVLKDTNIKWHPSKQNNSITSSYMCHQAYMHETYICIIRYTYYIYVLHICVVYCKRSHKYFILNFNRRINHDVTLKTVIKRRKYHTLEYYTFGVQVLLFIVAHRVDTFSLACITDTLIYGFVTIHWTFNIHDKFTKYLLRVTLLFIGI